MTPPISSALSTTLDGILAKGWQVMPDEFKGTGAAGLYLEKLLGSRNDNLDIPDLDGWEIKYHGGESYLLTLFHKEPLPQGHQKALISAFGKEQPNGEISFRHTITGGNQPTNLGFYLVNEGDKIAIKNTHDKGLELPFWTHDLVLSTFLAKFRRLILINGKTLKRAVIFEQAHVFEEPRSTNFINALSEGLVVVDFDMKLRANGSLRNHGTKFRIYPRNLPLLYHHVELFLKEAD
ncbi:MAG: hypothetical protein J4F41_08395 [Alphaproteobacteria bacterium]|nr:hypothetical protein [Alphaproteobacteria bacterium]